MIVPITTLVLVTSAGWLPSGHRWATGSLPVPYCITANATETNMTAAEQRTSLTNAINAWRNGAGGTLSCTTYDAVAQPAGQCQTSRNGNDGQNNIFWRRNWNQGSQTIGVTWSVFFNNCGNVTDDTGQSHQLQCSFDADIEFNDANYFWTDDGSGTDVESIAVHEYGHFVGLDHCDVNNTCQIGGGVMYAAYPGGTIRTLRNDDVQGGCGLYPGTQGGLGWPCANNNACSQAPICVNAGQNGYCTQTCGSCPTGYTCRANPQNAAQMVCLRDDGLNRALCEVCQGGIPNACADSGECFTGLPERSVGRCATPCPNPAALDGACPTNYTCLQVQGTDYCFPKSSDCTNLTNFTEIGLGQPCSGNPPCSSGLQCVGICSPECGSGFPACPSGMGCEAFQGGQSFCLPSVREGASCAGYTSCETGPCLNVSGTATCFRDCAGNPGACNNAQTCNTYNLQGGGQVSICEPPGVPPRPDAGIPPDTGVPGCACDVTGSCDLGCACDPACVVDEDGGVAPGQDASTPPPSDGGGVSPPKPDASVGPVTPCSCDETYACDPGCDSCDPECQCSCDETFACDPGCGSCDPECQGGTGCSGCSSTEGAAGSPALLLLFFIAGVGLLGMRRFLR